MHLNSLLTARILKQLIQHDTLLLETCLGSFGANIPLSGL